MKKINLLIAFLLTMMAQSHAQEWKSLSADDLFKMARQTAFDGKREESREMLKSILSQNTQYDEVRVFLARTYAWDQRWDEAIQELKIVLTHDVLNQEGLLLMAEVSFWKTDYEEALVKANQGLGIYPSSEAMLVVKANALINLQRLDEAASTLHQLLEINPVHEKASQLLATLENRLLKNTIGVSFEAQYFDKVFKPAFQSSIIGSRISSWGTAIARLNYANRFLLEGWQPEVELYPKIVKGVYAYVNYGYSSSKLFPKQKIGAELFSRVSKGWEASAGARYLYFTSLNKATIFTGSLSYYLKNYWISWRPYLTTGGPKNALSNAVSIRRYLKDSENFIGLLGGFGFSPDERRIQTSAGLGVDEIFLLRSQRVQLLWQKTLPKKFSMTLTNTLTHQELAYDQGNYVWSWGISAWLRKRF